MILFMISSTVPWWHKDRPDRKDGGVWMGDPFGFVIFISFYFFFFALSKAALRVFALRLLMRSPVARASASMYRRFGGCPG